MSLCVNEGASTLHDAALHEEVLLLVDIIIAASDSPVPLTQVQIDEVLFGPQIPPQRYTSTPTDIALAPA